MKINAFAAFEPKSSLREHRYESSELGPFDVEVRITHSGICHSDIHLVDNDWGVSTYPLVPGHEIIGKVVARGKLATHHEIGARVGIGWQRSACLECEYCVRGDENFCAAQQATCVGHHGGFADGIRVDGRFAFPIPDELSSENAAPLLCAGVTVYSPLKSFGVRPAHRVGVIGIGGLGHLAIQFAAKMGCEVTAFSTTADKEAESRRHGARRFVVSRDARAMAEVAGTLDFIISTIAVNYDVEPFVNALRVDGKLCFVGIPPEPLNFPVRLLLNGRKSLCASVIGSRPMMREMLEFAARHGVVAQTEALPLARMNEAIEKVRANKARYRMVLTT